MAFSILLIFSLMFCTLPSMLTARCCIRSVMSSTEAADSSAISAVVLTVSASVNDMLNISPMDAFSTPPSLSAAFNSCAVSRTLTDLKFLILIFKFPSESFAISRAASFNGLAILFAIIRPITANKIIAAALTAKIIK